MFPPLTPSSSSSSSARCAYPDTNRAAIPERAHRRDHEHRQVATAPAPELQGTDRILGTLLVPRHVLEGPSDGLRHVDEKLVGVGRSVLAEEIDTGVRRQRRYEACQTGSIFRRIGKRMGPGKILDIDCNRSPGSETNYGYRSRRTRNASSRTASTRRARSTSVEGADAYVIQSLHSGPSQSAADKLCRLLFLIGALKDAGAARVTAVTPYLCYARKDRRTKARDPVTTRYLANLFESVGTDMIVTLDVHNPSAFENAFRCRTITARPRRCLSIMLERAFVDAFRSDCVIEHAALVQPTHHDQPVDHGAAPGERQAMPHRRQRHHVDIHVAGKPAVELKLGAAGRLAARQRRDRGRENAPTFSACSARPGEKHPRHVRPDALSAPRRRGAIVVAREIALLRHAHGGRSAGWTRPRRRQALQPGAPRSFPFEQEQRAVELIEHRLVYAIHEFSHARRLLERHGPVGMPGTSSMRSIRRLGMA